MAINTFFEQIPYLAHSLLGTKYDYQYVAKSKNACLSYENGCIAPLGKMVIITYGNLYFLSSFKQLTVEQNI